MLAYTVIFDRIGRNRSVPPLECQGKNAFDLAEQIYAYARPHLGSRGIEVIAPDQGTGHIFAGFQTAGTFTVTSIDLNDKDS